MNGSIVIHCLMGLHLWAQKALKLTSRLMSLLVPRVEKLEGF